MDISSSLTELSNIHRVRSKAEDKHFTKKDSHNRISQDKLVVKEILESPEYKEFDKKFSDNTDQEY